MCGIVSPIASAERGGPFRPLPPPKEKNPSSSVPPPRITRTARQDFKGAFLRRPGEPRFAIRIAPFDCKMQRTTRSSLSSPFENRPVFAKAQLAGTSPAGAALERNFMDELMTENIIENTAGFRQRGQALLEETKRAAAVTDEYVHENPWTALGIAAALGLLVGFLLGQRNH